MTQAGPTPESLQLCAQLLSAALIESRQLPFRPEQALAQEPPTWALATAGAATRAAQAIARVRAGTQIFFRMPFIVVSFDRILTLVQIDRPAGAKAGSRHCG